jgi:hypothetical protein
MSNLREKAREVKEAGVAERGNFTPSGVPKRVYQWWLNESNSKRARKIRAGTQKDNFCHFWRVVLLWAPARKLAYLLGRIVPILGVVVGIAAIAATLIGAILNPLAALSVLAILAVLVLQAFGAFAGVSAAMTPDLRSDLSMFEDTRLIAVFGVLGLPLFVLSFVIVRFVRFYRDNLTDYNKQVGLSVLGLVSVLVGFLGGSGFLLPWILILVTSAVTLYLLVLALATVSDYISGRRVLAKQRREDLLAVYIAENGHAPVHVPNAFERRMAKIFSGIGDLVVLLAQVVRVKKWGICPLVEIDDERDSEPVAA